MKAELIVREILLLMGISKVWPTRFMTHLFLLSLSLRGRYNFTNMARYGFYTETTYRSYFSGRFDFLSFNMHLVDRFCPSPKIVVFDPSFIRKSGKHTVGIGSYWSGCSSKAIRGLEIGSFAAVEIAQKRSMHLIAEQTQLPKKGKGELMQWYISLFQSHALDLKKVSLLLVVDAYFSKKNYVDAVMAEGMTVVSRFRYDVRMRYLYQGEPTGKQGRPKEYDGKVISTALNMEHLEEIETGIENERAYEGIVYADALKRKVKAVFVYPKGITTKSNVKIYFSTNLKMSGIEILQAYKARFHIEFLFRDAKQYTGLEHAQCRSKEKLAFHFNLSLSTVSIAKAEQIELENDQKPFSMQSTKAFYFNKLLLERFIEAFSIQADTEENKKKIRNLSLIGRVAA